MKKIILPEDSKHFNISRKNKYAHRCFYVDNYLKPTIVYTGPRIGIPTLIDMKQDKTTYLKGIKSTYERESKKLFLDTYKDVVMYFGLVMEFTIVDNTQENYRPSYFSNILILDVDTGHRYTVAGAFTIHLLDYIQRGVFVYDPKKQTFKGVFVTARTSKKIYLKPIPLLLSDVTYA